jgi:hypothetical protein
MIGFNVEMATIGKDRNALAKPRSKGLKTSGQTRHTFRMFTPGKALRTINDTTR